MPEGVSLINLDGLSAPATKLLEIIQDTVVGMVRPSQIKRVATAEAEALQVKSIAQIQVDEIKQRALHRVLHEESINQANMESITRMALPDITEDAKPENVDPDWLRNFFDKCRLVSDKEMQAVWAKILANESNVNSSFSKRTVNLLSGLDKKDAEIFTLFCSFVWNIGSPVPLIFDWNNKIYTDNGLNYSSLVHLDDIGLISFEALSDRAKTKLPRSIEVAYFDKIINLQFDKEEGNNLSIGKILLTNVGIQLSNICSPEPIDDFYDYVVKKWSDDGLNPQQKK